MAMRTLVAFMMVAVALAGCADDGEGPGDGPTSAECLEQGLILNATAGPDGAPACVQPPFEIRDFEDPRHHCVVSQQRDRVHAPDLVGDPWILGQYWDFSLAVDGEDLGTTRLVYYDDQDFDGDVPQHYMVGTPTRDEALRHAIFGENPMIGRVHRILYSPHESGDHADMFHFPLCDGSSWTTVFYGETFTLQAREIPVPDARLGPVSGGRAFQIAGTSADGGSLTLTYSTEAQWFTFIDLDRAGGGTVDLQLQEVGTGYQGEAFFLRGQNDETVGFGGVALPVAAIAVPEVASATIERADGDEGPYDTLALHIVARLNGSGLANVTVTAPDGTDAYAALITGAGGSVLLDDVLEVPFQTGTWTVDMEGLAAGEGAAATVIVTTVSIYDRSGSV